MKKMLKNITTAFAAAVLALAPVYSNANAASVPVTNTYRIYVDAKVKPHVPFQQYQANIYLTFTSHKNIKHCGGRLAPNTGGTFYRNGNGTQTLTHSFFDYEGYAETNRNFFTFTCTQSSADSDNVYYSIINEDRGMYPQLKKSSGKTSSEFDTAEILVGDVSGNGFVTDYDLEKLNYLIETKSSEILEFGNKIVDDYYRAADINNDGMINDTDSDLLKAYLDSSNSRVDFADPDFTYVVK